MSHRWRWWWGIGVTLAIGGCAPKLASEPWPCTMIDERPQVAAELKEMKRTKSAVLQLEGPGASLTPMAIKAPDGLYLATREWVVDANAKCAADRALVGKLEEQRKLTPFGRLKSLFQ